jgi:hypothetical protein
MGLRNAFLSSLLVVGATALPACVVDAGTDLDANNEQDLGQASQAVVTSLASPLQSSVYVARSTGTPAFLGRAGNMAAPDPSWHLAQWGIPADVQPAAGAASDWSNGNGYGAIHYYASEASGNNVYELAQNGQTAALPCGKETDFFLETGDPATYPGKPDGFVLSAPLNTLTAATMSVGLKVVYETNNGRCPSPNVNYVGYVTSLVLTNPTSNQTLFYQIDLRDSRGISSNMSWCPAYEGMGNGLFCLDDGVGILGGTVVQANGVRTNNAGNILPRLQQILATQHHKASYPGQVLDSNLSNWKIQNAYFGQVLQGGVIATSRWYDYSFTTTQ